jgi:hypothetical protein
LLAYWLVLLLERCAIIAAAAATAHLVQARVVGRVHEHDERGIVGYLGRYERVVVAELVPSHDAVRLAGRVERVQEESQRLFF